MTKRVFMGVIDAEIDHGIERVEALRQEWHAARERAMSLESLYHPKHREAWRAVGELRRWGATDPTDGCACRSCQVWRIDHARLWR